MFALKSNGEIIEVFGTLKEAKEKLEYMKRVVDKAYVKMFGYVPIYREIEEIKQKGENERTHKRSFFLQKNEHTFASGRRKFSKLSENCAVANCQNILTITPPSQTRLTHGSHLKLSEYSERNAGPL